MKENVYITRKGKRQINAVSEYSSLTAHQEGLAPLVVDAGMVALSPTEVCYALFAP